MGLFGNDLLRNIGDTIGGFGQAASSLLGRNVGIGLGGTISGAYNPTHQQLQASQANIANNASPYNFSSANPSSYTSAPSGLLGVSTRPPSIGSAFAATSGGGGAPAAGGATQGPAQTGVTPSSVTNQLDPNLQTIIGNYNLQKQNLANQGIAYDTDYNNSKTDINGLISNAQTTADNQKTQVGQQYGTQLADQLQTYKDLSKQRQGMFSSLGTLDSSAFGDQQGRADEDYARQKLGTENNQQNTFNNIDSTFQNYQTTANKQLGDLTSQYQKGKDALQNALSQGNLNEAGAINQEVSQIAKQAQAIQQQQQQWASQVDYLKAFGVNVNNSMQGMNATGVSSNAPSLSATQQFGSNLVPQLVSGTAPSGVGYQGKDGKIYPDFQTAAMAGAV